MTVTIGRRELLVALVARWLRGRSRRARSKRARCLRLLSVFAESDPEGQALIKELMQGLQGLGWVNGRNVRIDFRFGGVDAAHISTLAMRQQTLSIPIVFVQVVDPVSAGFVTNLARPEGNITNVEPRGRGGPRLAGHRYSAGTAERQRKAGPRVGNDPAGCA